MFSFDSKLIKTDVTSVKLTSKYIFAGIGGYLHIFNRETNQLINKFEIFYGCAIHGIVVNILTNRILIYGSNKIKLFNFKECLLEEIFFKELNDWILHAKILNDDKLAFILMHNQLIILDYNKKNEFNYKCSEHCILYSAFICNYSLEKLVILSGTVISEILIWRPLENREKNPVLIRLKGHKGVIFSLDYNEKAGLITSASDDRTTIIWNIPSKNILKELEKFPININLKHHIKGHLARIFCCKITTDNNYIVTGGEDSLLNIWNSDGELFKKFQLAHNNTIWCIDSDENFVVVGAGDGKISLFSLINHINKYTEVLPNYYSPKQVAILNSGNFVVITDTGILGKYHPKINRWIFIRQFDDLKKYFIFSISICRKKFSLSGYNGQIYVYQENPDYNVQLIYQKSPSDSRIYSSHWLSCKFFLTYSQGGLLDFYYLKKSKINKIFTFSMPVSKDNCSTTACFGKNKSLIVGDRKGHIYLYQLGIKEPVQIVKNVHNHLGITQIYFKNNSIISLGKDSTIKIFTFKNNFLQFNLFHKVSFSWLTNLNDSFLLGFSGSNFIIWDTENRQNIIEIDCGSGHRSWDCFYNDVITFFIFIKSKSLNIYTWNWGQHIPCNLIEGFHTKTINTLKIIKYKDCCLLISGSEDTILRLSKLQSNYQFYNIYNLKSHLSSIRTISIYSISNDEYLICSAGGRAQIILWKLNNFNCSEQSSYYESLDSNDSEIRIMDLILNKIYGKLILFAACSDGNIKIFYIEKMQEQYLIHFIHKIFYKSKCIFKICILYMNNVDILLTMASDGKIIFWKINSDYNLNQFYSIDCHQSAINSYSYHLINYNTVIFVTGGDDNEIIINLFQLKENQNNLEVKLLHQINDIISHCGQVSGCIIWENYLLTTSIDQKLNLFKWYCSKENLISFKKIAQYNSTISDIHGLKIIPLSNNDLNVILYGNGIEIINVLKR